MIELAAIASVFLAFSLLSNRLWNTILSAPIFFVTAGFVLGSRLFPAVDFGPAAPYFLVLGILALSLSLFNQALRISPAALRGTASLPARLLLIGLPLTIGAGALAGVCLFPGLGLIEAVLLGTIPAPSDTGLIAAVMGSERVPGRIRQALNVESSLNDGITTPIAVLFMSMAQSGPAFAFVRVHWLSPLTQLALALVTGVMVGVMGGWLLREADRRDWINPGFQGLVFPALTMITLSLTYMAGGNYFVACFVAGTTTAWTLSKNEERYSRFSETAEHMAGLVVLLVLGAKFVERISALDWRIVLYAVLSLTVIRMAPVSIALRGTKLRRESVLFLGWFGPRGLASVVLGTLVLVHVPGIAYSDTIALTVMTTVALSIVLHGVSAIPLVVRYGQRAAQFEADAPEKQPVADMPIRMGWSVQSGSTEARISAWEERVRH